MTDTQTKPSLNGVIRLNRRGRAKFQFDDAEPAFEIDILSVYDEWCDVDMELREVNEEKQWVLPPKKSNEYGQNRLNFVQGVINEAYAKIEGSPPVPTIDRAQAEEFVNQICTEAAKLRNFTSPKSETPSSPPENTATERINFSQ